jgi:hypothetical protein
MARDQWGRGREWGNGHPGLEELQQLPSSLPESDHDVFGALRYLDLGTRREDCEFIWPRSFDLGDASGATARFCDRNFGLRA